MPFSSPGDLPDPRIEALCLHLPHWQAGSLLLVPPGKPHRGANTPKLQETHSAQSVESTLSSVRLFVTPWILYSPWNSPGQNTEVDSLSLLQGIFPTQGLNPGLSHCRRIHYQLSHKGSQLKSKSKQKTPTPETETKPKETKIHLKNGYFSKEDMQISKCMKECSTSLIKQFETTIRHHLTLVIMAFIRKTANKCWQESREEGTLVHC